MKKTLLFIIVMATQLIVAQEYQFTEFDVNNNGPSFPQAYVEFNNELYFRATSQNGYELYKTDGVSPPVLVKDINLGNGSSTPRRFTIFNNEMYFTADDGVHGRELWKTDGTEQGTVLVADLLSGIGGGFTNAEGTFPVYDNKIYFVGRVQGAGNISLFSSDGTESGTSRVSDNVKMNFSLTVDEDITVYNNEIIFQGSDNNTGRELWKSDGTEVGTGLILDLNPGTSSSFPAEMTLYNGKLYLVAEGAINDNEVYSYDGTSLNLLKNISLTNGSIQNFARFIVFNNLLFFAANDGATGREIWVSDGTETGTTLLKDINPVAGNGSIEEGDAKDELFFVANNKLYFAASNSLDASNNFDNLEPWTTDGTEAGTQIVADINPNGNSIRLPYFFLEYNGHLFFRGIKPNNSSEGLLYASDAPDSNSFSVITPVNTTFQNAFVFNPYVFNNSIFYSAQYDINGSSNGNELWKITDSTLSVVKFHKDEVTLYPNPTDSKLHIQSNVIIEAIKIVSISGKIIDQQSLKKSHHTIDVSNLPAGIYCVQTTTEKSLSNIKFIKY